MINKLIGGGECIDSILLTDVAVCDCVWLSMINKLIGGGGGGYSIDSILLTDVAVCDYQYDLAVSDYQWLINWLGGGVQYRLHITDRCGCVWLSIWFGCVWLSMINKLIGGGGTV